MEILTIFHAVLELVVQHIPQVQSLLNAAPQAAPAPAPPHIIANPFANPVNTQVRAPAQNPSGPMNNPFLAPGPVYAQSAYQQNAAPPAAAAPVPVPQSAAPTTNGAVYLAPSAPPAGAQPLLHLSTQEAADDLECLIPGCGKPVHRDAQGLTTSDYCSMRHRECVLVPFTRLFVLRGLTVYWYFFLFAERRWRAGTRRRALCA